LQKSFDLIEQWVKNYGGQAGPGVVPEWQKLEAPLFSMRAMGRMVPADESIMLPRLVPLIVQIPDHEKVRFQAVMALGRYTEWTAQHPDTLQPQLDFIMAAFDHSSKEVVRAAALSFKFFCNDCANLLHEFVPQIQQFYSNVLDKLPPSSQEELTDGVASVFAKQPLDKIYETLKLYCDPVMQAIINLAQNATDEASRLVLADKLQLLTIFIQWVQPYTAPGLPNPAVKYCEEIFPVLSAIAQTFDHCIPILERVCRCWRYMVFSYRTAMTPLLEELAKSLVKGFSTSRQGCFLWATDAVVREFSEGKDGLDPAVSNAVFNFYEQQATTFLRALSEVPPEELPDLIEDFFRLTGDVLLFYAYKAIPSSLMAPILSAASTALTLLKEEPLMATLHFMRDFLAYGSDRMPISTFSDGPGQPTMNPPEIQAAVKQLVTAQGQDMVQRLMTGMMYSFPRDCVPDASGALLQMLHLLPQHVATWIKNTINLLPAGSMTPQESERLINNINQRVQAGEIDKIRPMLQDFTTSYRRRNVAPREGLGRLEATRFKFSG
jgi:transportin-3